ncbi:hypothetical protein COB21_00840 [Candidatus Aerophobetes bacterium]|uniref:RING-type domain-containing protein n=1 Tax=Aerophobetes bacterium TaxID=2030807 RepID=A0A2A4X767_UNCAE|nr:MAG: hypothetical protein COB21_00840 [Candidatus Aerophobetes bacterium]
MGDYMTITNPAQRSPAQEILFQMRDVKSPQSTCFVCTEQMDPTRLKGGQPLKERIARLACTHILCGECALNWININAQPPCPICRAEIKHVTQFSFNGEGELKRVGELDVVVLKKLELEQAQQQELNQAQRELDQVISIPEVRRLMDQAQKALDQAQEALNQVKVLTLAEQHAKEALAQARDELAKVQERTPEAETLIQQAEEAQAQARDELKQAQAAQAPNVPALIVLAQEAVERVKAAATAATQAREAAATRGARDAQEAQERAARTWDRDEPVRLGLARQQRENAMVAVAGVTFLIFYIALIRAAVKMQNARYARLKLNKPSFPITKYVVFA